MEKQPLFCDNGKWSIIYKNTESLCCTPETNVTLPINYTSIFLKKGKAEKYLGKTQSI